MAAAACRLSALAPPSKVCGGMRAVVCVVVLLHVALVWVPPTAQAASYASISPALEHCPSQQCRIVFVHVPKTGGSTFIQAMVAWSARHGFSFVRCMQKVTPQSCRGWTTTAIARKEENRVDGESDGVEAPSFKEVPADVRGARVIFGHMAFAPLPHGEAVNTAYVTVLREPVSRIISHYNYVMPTRSFAAWYRHSVKRRACNLQVAYLAGMGHSGPLSTANSRCARVGAEHLRLACRHLRSNFSLVGLHDFHLEFDRRFLCLFGGMDVGAADMVLAHHTTPHEHRGHHSAHFHPVSLAAIVDDTVIEEIFEDNLLDVLLYLYTAVLLEKLPPNRWPTAAAGREAAERARRLRTRFSSLRDIGKEFDQADPQTTSHDTSPGRASPACVKAMAFKPPSSPAGGDNRSAFSVLHMMACGGGDRGGEAEVPACPGRQHALLHRLYTSALGSALFRSLLAADSSPSQDVT